jgi:cephalosporin hydroxylase
MLPERLYLFCKVQFLSRRMRQLVAACQRQADLGGVVDVVLASPEVRPEQKRSEILGLLTLLQGLKPGRLCEIGGRAGGSLALFAHVAQPSARLLSIDLGYKPGQDAALRALAVSSQSVTCLAADSHAPETVRAVSDWLGGTELDFLFIDGDHTFDGVAADLAMYGPFVRDGGLVAFHDIVPDSRSRGGPVTSSDAGDVPRFWQSLKDGRRQVQEIIDDPQQDGFGIGVLHWSKQSTGRD